MRGNGAEEWWNFDCRRGGNDGGGMRPPARCENQAGPARVCLWAAHSAAAPRLPAPRRGTHSRRVTRLGASGESLWCPKALNPSQNHHMHMRGKTGKSDANLSHSVELSNSVHICKWRMSSTKLSLEFILLRWSSLKEKLTKIDFTFSWTLVRQL